METISLVLVSTALTSLAFIWLHDRWKGEDARHPQAYQHQGSKQTLREGLTEYYATNGLLPPENLSAENAAGLRAHDAAHVVFGCNDSPRGEVVLIRWSVFGARDAMPQYIRGLRSAETRWLFADFFRKLRPTQLILGLLDGFQAVVRSLRMPARWPTDEWEQHLDRSLVDIRSDYNIHVV